MLRHLHVEKFLKATRINTTLLKRKKREKSSINETIIN
jgi:hypothetical protein